MLSSKLLLVMTFLLPTSVYAQQFLPVKGIVNARDLGGYEVEGGMQVKTGRLIRAAQLADAADADIAYLASLPVTLVVDFRTEVDLKGKANRDVPGAKYVNLPIDASGNATATATEEEKKKMTGRKKFDVKKVILFAAFNATNRVYAKDVKRYSRRIKLLGGKAEEIAVVKAFLGCNTENFVKALDAIVQQFGSLEAYLKGPMGLTDDDIKTLRERYLER